MSTISHKQPVALVQQTMLGYDNSEFSKHQLNYQILASNPPPLANYGNNNVSGSIIQGNQQHMFNNIQFQLSQSNNFSPISHSRKDSVCQIESTPRGPNDIGSLSLNELSVGIMSHHKLNKPDPRTSAFIAEPSDWRRMDTNQISSPSSPSSLSSTSSTTALDNNGSNMLFSTSSNPSSLPVFATNSIDTNTSEIISTVTGSPPAMEYTMTNQNYILVHNDQQSTFQNYHRHQQQQHQQQQQQQQYQQQQQLRARMQQGNMSQYVPYSGNDFQGLACNGHPGTYTQHPSWNIGIASSSVNNETHLTNPSANTVPTATSGLAWANGSVQVQYGPNDSHIQRQGQGQGHSQRFKQTKHQSQLHIMTSLESGFASMCPQTASSFADSPIPSLAGAHNIMQSPAAVSSQHGYRGMAPSPIENSFSSGSSTPSFASMSPSLSYSNSELGGASCDSSRPTSPMFSQPHEGYLSERRLRKLEAESSQIIRSRKSSTSSTSSSSSQRRMSTLRESTTCPPSPIPSSGLSGAITTTSTSTNNQCPTCRQCFAGPAVLIRHIESIHEKLLWNCVGCKSNLSRRDAVTRHINLSPMDSVCRTVGTIGQIKMINGNEIHYEVSSYRAKPLDEVMSRMGKKIPAALKREMDLAKARGEGNIDGTFGDEYKYEEDVLYRVAEDENEGSDVLVKMEYNEDYEDEAGQKKRRRPSLPAFARKK